MAKKWVIDQHWRVLGFLRGDEIPQSGVILTQPSEPDAGGRTRLMTIELQPLSVHALQVKGEINNYDAEYILTRYCDTAVHLGYVSMKSFTI